MGRTIVQLNPDWLARANAAPAKPRSLDIHTGRSMPERMRSLFDGVTRSILDPKTEIRSAEAMRGAPARDDESEIRVAANWIRQRVAYRGEIPGFDIFPTLEATLEIGAADCNRFCVVGCALFTSRGYATGVRIVMWNQHEGHAYNLLRLPRQACASAQSTVPLDLSEGGAPLGWECDLRSAMSVQDYWYEPLPWIAWYKSGTSIVSAPLPVPRKPT